MPEYTFLCSNCKDIFSVVMSISEYMDKQICPICKKSISVRRHYQSDISGMTNAVRKNDDEIKVGHLAARNTERMSADERDALTRQHNEYKYKEPEKELPKGMTRLGNPKNRRIPTKQNKRDPRKSKRNVKRKRI